MRLYLYSAVLLWLQAAGGDGCCWGRQAGAVGHRRCAPQLCRAPLCQQCGALCCTWDLICTLAPWVGRLGPHCLAAAVHISTIAPLLGRTEAVGELRTQQRMMGHGMPLCAGALGCGARERAEQDFLRLSDAALDAMKQ